MKIHHLNCGTLCPARGYPLKKAIQFLQKNSLAKSLQKFEKFLPFNAPEIISKPMSLVCHCLLIELPDQLVLVDTGLGLQDIRFPKDRIPAEFLYLLGGPILDEKETAIRQIEKLGFNAADVKHIILTHLDIDHAGGLSDFPNASIHLLKDEYNSAQFPRGVIQKKRYNSKLWGHHPNWQLYDQEGENWNGFKRVKNLKGLPPEISIIPLIGHTSGHLGVIIEQSNYTHFFVGDAYIHHNQLTKPEKTPSYVELYNLLVQENKSFHLENLEKLRALHLLHNDKIKIYCSHDPYEFKNSQRLDF